MSLGLQPEDAADLMEAALATSDEPLPPGPKLDELVAGVLGVEPERHWIVTHDGGESSAMSTGRWTDLRTREDLVEWLHERHQREQMIEYEVLHWDTYRPYSTDPGASDEARRLARKDIGDVVVLADQPNGPDTNENFIAWMAIEPPSIDEDHLHHGLEIWVNVGGLAGQRGKTEEHAVALAIVAAGGGEG